VKEAMEAAQEDLSKLDPIAAGVCENAILSTLGAVSKWIEKALG
jgi:hypothetical protein